MKHQGGPCPFDPTTVVRFLIRAAPKVRYGEHPTAPAGSLRWSHDGGPGDIMFAKAVS